MIKYWLINEIRNEKKWRFCRFAIKSKDTTNKLREVTSQNSERKKIIFSINIDKSERIFYEIMEVDLNNLPDQNIADAKVHHVTEP